MHFRWNDATERYIEVPASEGPGECPHGQAVGWCVLCLQFRLKQAHDTRDELRAELITELQKSQVDAQRQLKLIKERDLLKGLAKQANDVWMKERSKTHIVNNEKATLYSQRKIAVEALHNIKAQSSDPISRFIAENAIEEVTPKNSCDGCNAGIAVDDNGNHRMGSGAYADYMGCEAHRYTVELK